MPELEPPKRYRHTDDEPQTQRKKSKKNKKSVQKGVRHSTSVPRRSVNITRRRAKSFAQIPASEKTIFSPSAHLTFLSSL